MQISGLRWWCAVCGFTPRKLALNRCCKHIETENTMLIAIDESGNFNTDNNQYNMFVAAHIQNKDGNLEIKKKQFESWENKVPANMRDRKGEIKGQLLGKVELKNFIKNVVFQKPEIRFTYVSINPWKNKKELINKHKTFESLQIELSLEN